MKFTPELIVYTILSLVDRMGSVDAARMHIEAKQAEGKTVDAILEELQNERKQAAQERRDAVNQMPG